MQTKVEICGVNTSGLPVLSAKKTDELLKKSAAGDKQARDELIRGNLRLVLSVVQRFQGRGESPDDLFQVGCIGLMKAIDNFNTELGVRFSTYAVPMIIGGVITGSIMITSAVVMRGMSVNNAMDMAVQLEGTLGRFAQPFMALGLLSAGISSALCSPISVSYVLAGLFDWKTDGSDKRFLGTSAIILIVGIIISAIGTNPLALIMTAQAVNGIALPVVVGVTLYLASRQRIMGEYKNSMLQNIIGLMIFAISLILGISSFIGVFAG
mgnify:CR=1 FL=1